MYGLGFRWWMAALLLVWVPAGASSQELPYREYAHEDPELIVTAEKCGECHLAAFDIWKESPHAKGFKTLHREPLAESIAKKMGFRLIKRQSFCYSCHYTAVVSGDTLKVVSGVSCESCHGAARDWIDRHNDYGEGVNHANEPAEHRRQRVADSRKEGMRRPSDLYPVVANCFGCHTVPNEDLINIGGHTSGSSAFEFVEWSQGVLRHNFLDSLRKGTSAQNRQRGPQRLRVMYVVGRALDLEYSVRGMAEAKNEGVYAKAMSRRIRSAVSELRAISRSTEIPEINRMIEVVKGARMAPGNKSALLEIADRIGELNRDFLDNHDGSRLAGLDPLRLGQSEPEPVLADAGPEAGPGTGVSAGDATAAGAPRAPGTTPSGGRIPGTAAATGSPSRSTTSSQPAATGIEGTFKTRVRAQSEHRTLGPGACSGCHLEQNEKWFTHAHYRSADPFFDGASKNLQIAGLYGISPAQMTLGRHVCMDCHGTVVSGKESREVLDGVSCESCHGAAADWLEPHKQRPGEEGLTGSTRPGYKRALPLGKTPLESPEIRARNCVECHYITEPRLISAGHPSGAGFDYEKGLGEIKHWDQTSGSADAIRTAFAGAKAARGTVPKVRVASLPSGTATAPAAPRAGARQAPRRNGSSPSLAVSAAESSVFNPPRARPYTAPTVVQTTEIVDLELPSFPEIDPTLPVEELMLLLAERLETLYQAVAPSPEGSE